MQSIFELWQISNVRGCCLAAIHVNVRFWRTGCTSEEVSVSISQNQKLCHLFCHLLNLSSVSYTQAHKLQSLVMAAIMTGFTFTGVYPTNMFMPKLGIYFPNDNSFNYLLLNTISSFLTRLSLPSTLHHMRGLQSSPTPQNSEKVENVIRTDQIFHCELPSVLLLAVFLAVFFYYKLSAWRLHKSRPDEQAGL